MSERTVYKGTPPSRRSPDKAHPAPALAAFRAIVRIEGLLRRLSEPHFAFYGVSPAQWGVLRSLERLEMNNKPQPRMHELGEALLVQPPSLSATLDRMERGGLISRRPDLLDKRSRRVALTGAGREVLSGAMTSHERWIRAVMAGLGGRQQTELESLLARLGDHMQGLVDHSQGLEGLEAEPRRRGRKRRSA